MTQAVYLDYNATTPLDPEVLEAMMPYLADHFGNAASRSHQFGWQAKDAVDKARSQIAELIDVGSNEIIFTSGATESVNLALKGIYYGSSAYKHIVVPPTEHKAVIDTVTHLESMGAQVTWLPVYSNGLVDPEMFEADIDLSHAACVVMWVNNETGLVQPMEEIGVVCQRDGALLICDATQAVGKMEVAPKQTGIDLLAFSAHKIYGPKGIGALYVDNERQSSLIAQQHGGGHERGLRSGTLNVPAIVGFGKAAELARNRLTKEQTSIAELRDYLETTLMSSLDGLHINGSVAHRISNTTNISFSGVHSEDLLLALGTFVGLSSGSACTSAAVEPSHVLTGMGLNSEMALSSIRFSLGRLTTKEEIDFAINKVIEAVNRIRSRNPLWQGQ
jgi:cysteine desulfurase